MNKASPHALPHQTAEPLFFTLCCVAALAILWASISAAQAESAPPSRVGRIGMMEGDVSFLNDTNEGWKRARVNFPVTSRNSVWVNGAGRAEIRIGASALRVSDESILDFVRVDDDKTRAFLQRGTLNVRLRSYGNSSAHSSPRSADDYRDGFRIETTEGTFILDANGRYRIDADQEKNQTRVSVFIGRMRFDNGGNMLTIEAGKALFVRNDLGNSSFSFETAMEAPFDRWAEARDQQWDETHSQVVRTRTVSPHMTGYEDLDHHGEWAEDREYGRVWAPRVVVSGWAPYRFGTWAYVRPWGWSWVDDAPWGFAPFHYGRWVIRGSRWWWSPGAYVRRPVYAPALVAWVGRPHLNISIGVGVGPSIGWFPLGPREYYVPSYYRGSTYVRNVNNVTNNITVINPPATYVNQTPGTTVVNQNVMVRGEPVQPAMFLAGTASGQPVTGQVVRAPMVRGEPVSQSPVPAPSFAPSAHTNAAASHRFVDGPQPKPAPIGRINSTPSAPSQLGAPMAQFPPKPTPSFANAPTTSQTGPSNSPRVSGESVLANGADAPRQTGATRSNPSNERVRSNGERREGWRAKPAPSESNGETHSTEARSDQRQQRREARREAQVENSKENRRVEATPKPGVAKHLGNDSSAAPKL